MDSSTKVRRSPRVLEAEVDGQLVLMSAVSGSYCGLDDICAEVWKRLAKPATVGELCVSLGAAYDGDSAVIERETIELLHRMAAQQLIEQTAA